MRRAQEIPFDWLADNKRWMRKPMSYESLADMLNEQTQFYRRVLGSNQADYVEIWLEKDVLSGVLYSVTSEFDVPLMVTRGYPSLSFLRAPPRPSRTRTSRRTCITSAITIRATWTSRAPWNKACGNSLPKPRFTLSAWR